MVHTSSASSLDPLDGKVLQYVSMRGEKGTIFFEPLSRMRLSDGNQDVRYDADAFGFAGSEQMGAGSIGLSVAYLHSSIDVVEHQAGLPDKSIYDTADGLRMNIGIRYPTGPATWGLLVQNAPGFLWGKEYQREILPFKARIGNTLMMVKDLYLSADYERRFYHEGSHQQSYYYVGIEALLSDYAVLRGGYFGTDVYQSDNRTATLGLSLINKSGAQISYAMEIFEQDGQSVKRSLVSIQSPFQSSEQSGLRN